MAKIRRTAEAETDLLSIWLYVADDNPNAADRLLRSIDAKCALLANNPLLGPERPDVAPGLRFLVAGSYLILYRTLDTGVEIVRVLHGARDVNGLFAAD